MKTAYKVSVYIMDKYAYHIKDDEDPYPLYIYSHWTNNKLVSSTNGKIYISLNSLQNDVKQLYLLLVNELEQSINSPDIIAEFMQFFDIKCILNYFKVDEESDLIIVKDLTFDELKILVGKINSALSKTSPEKSKSFNRKFFLSVDISQVILN